MKRTPAERYAHKRYPGYRNFQQIAIEAFEAGTKHNQDQVLLLKIRLSEKEQELKTLNKNPK